MTPAIRDESVGRRTGNPTAPSRPSRPSEGDETMNCEHCQPLLLDHLYGLLDGPEAAAVDAHLASCPTCAAARAEADRVQGLISRAAKSAFPQTRFEAPDQPAKVAPTTPAPASPATLPFP